MPRAVFHLTGQSNPARVSAAYYPALANEREEAIAVFEAEGAALPDTAYGSVTLFLSRALQGDGEGAVRHISPPLEQAAAWTEYLALFLADGYSLIGRNDETIGGSARRLRSTSSIICFFRRATRSWPAFDQIHASRS